MKRSVIRFSILPFLIIPLILSGCVHQSESSLYTKDGKVYGQVRGTFRHKWWNYYERGTSFADGRFFEEAAKDFKSAIAKREKDRRMARTYGMHFVEYFPHRELGIVYFQWGNLKAAEKELSISLDQYPTSKAHFYLDRVRKGLVEEKGAKVAAPRLSLVSPKDALWTREDPVIIAGTARDENYVASLAINGVPLFMEGSKERISFSKPMELDQGRHEILVESGNLMGRVARQSILIHVDRQGPVITIEDFSFCSGGSGSAPTLRGHIYDEAGIASLIINGTVVPIKKGIEVDFFEKLPIETDTVELMAVDSLGNRTSAQIDTRMLSMKAKPVMLAFSGSKIEGLLADFSKDKEPPLIFLDGWSDEQDVFMDRVFLDGHAEDNHVIHSLTINQKSILRRKGQRIFFNRVVPLKAGKNLITVKAADAAGNISTRELVVTRHIPKALHLAERLSMTVFPFEQKGKVPEASLSFQENLTDALLDRKRFRLIEREKLDLILQEQKLSRSKLIDKTTALKLGRLAAAHTIVAGTIVESGMGVEIIGRVIDTETSEILASEDVYDEIKNLRGLKNLAEGMAIRIHRKFPLVDGTVIKQSGKWITTDLGREKIGLQRRLIVYREAPVKHPATGKNLGWDNKILGRARVVQVMPGMSKAEIVDGIATSMAPFDKVISQ